MPPATESRALRRLARTACVLGALAGFAAVAGAATRGLPQQAGAVDLATSANVSITGAVAYDRAGYSVAAAGDVNGDGRADIVVGAPGASNNGRRISGSAYVVFGQEEQRGLDLAALGDGGFRIDGAEAFTDLGGSAAGIGDVDGDGLADVAVSGATAVYVVFGKKDGAPVDLAALGAGGFRVSGAGIFDYAGIPVAAAGDVNGDGRPDLLVGVRYAGTDTRSFAGAAYVVFGKGTSTDVDLGALGDGGFRIEGAYAYGDAGSSVAGVGDLNGDGRADVVIGAPYTPYEERGGAGAAFVVFGKKDGATVDLGALGDGGFVIEGAAAWDFAGTSVAGVGDVNLDGRGDIAVGAPGADNGPYGSGSAYVVFGKGGSDEVDLAELGQGGFRIDGANVYDAAGTSVAGAGDVNGDGRPDVLVGAPYAANNGRISSGSAYVVFGTGSGATFDLSQLEGKGFRMDGANVYFSTGGAVAGAGDVNGDGRSDVVVGAASAGSDGRPAAGAAYVVDGFGEPKLAYDPLVAHVGEPIAVHRPRLVERTGLPRFFVSHPLPSGLQLDAATGEVFGRPTAASARTTYSVSMTDLTGTVIAPLELTVIDATAPRVELGGAPVQRILRRGALVVQASCNEPCTLFGSGRIVPSSGAAIPLRGTRARLRSAGRIKLRLALTRAGRARLARAGSTLRADVTVRAVDRSGNARTVRRTYRVAR